MKKEKKFYGSFGGYEGRGGGGRGAQWRGGVRGEGRGGGGAVEGVR